MSKDLLPKVGKKGKGTPPPPARPESNNLVKPPLSAKAQVNFQATREKKREIELYAAEKDMYVHELLVAAFDEYVANHP